MALRLGKRSRSAKREPVPRSAFQVRNVRQMVKQEIERTAEKKLFCAQANGGVDSSGSVVSVLNVPQGVEDDSRIGDSVSIVKMGLRYYWSNGDNVNVCRFLIVQWFDDGAPAVTDILATANTLSCFNKDTAQLYSVLFDWTHSLSAPYNGGSVYSPVMVKDLTPKRKTVKFSATTTTGVGKLFYLAITDSAAPSHPNLYMETACTYIDM